VEYVESRTLESAPASPWLMVMRPAVRELEPAFIWIGCRLHDGEFGIAIWRASPQLAEALMHQRDSDYQHGADDGCARQPCRQNDRLRMKFPGRQRKSPICE
jgi:hypothetical protein